MKDSLCADKRRWQNRSEPKAIASLPPQNISKHQRRNDRCIRLDDVLRCLCFELAPGDLFIRDGTGVRAVRCCRIGDLTEVTPDGNALALQILMKHRDDADRKIPGDAAADLEEADRRSL